MVTKTNKFESPPQHKNSNLNKVKCEHKKLQPINITKMMVRTCHNKVKCKN